MSLALITHGLYGSGLGSGASGPGLYDPDLVARAILLVPSAAAAETASQRPEGAGASDLRPSPLSGSATPQAVPEPSHGLDLKPEPTSAGEE